MNLLKKRGPKVNPKINEKIMEILRELKVGTPETIRLAYTEKYNRGIGWNTVDRRLKNMVDRNIIQQKVLNTGVRKITAVYSFS